MPDPSQSSASPGRPAPGQDAGFEDAYRQHAAAVFGLARRLLGDRTLAEEVTQEVFLRLWRRPERFDAARGSVRTFLLTECHSRSIDAIRAESARRLREERDGRSDAGRVVTDVAADVCDSSVHRHVALLIQALPDGEREAIALAYSAEVTYRQVAMMLDVPLGTVKGRLRSGLRRLRSQLGDSVIDIR